MVRAKECSINVEFALALKSLDKALAQHFRCVECNALVEAHEAGVGPDNVYHPAHFEHVTANKECPRSHRYKGTAAA